MTLLLSLACTEADLIHQSHDPAHLDEHVDDVAQDTGFDLDAEVVDPLNEEKAWQVMLVQGVDPLDLVYFGRLPLAVDEASAEMTWGAIEQQGGDLVVTHLDLYDGSVLVDSGPAPENLVSFVEENDLVAGLQGTSPNTYNTFPWSWQLPMGKTGSLAKTWGYGHGSSYGDYYAVDFDPGNAGHRVEAPASCWVMYTSYNSGYGYQVVAECGATGSNGQNYYYRVAHLRKAASVKPGWWVKKGTAIGEMGQTGFATGDHIHFVVYRAKSTSGGKMNSYNSVPINGWPSSGDSICHGGIASWSLSGNSTKFLGSVRGDTGCP